VKSRRPVLIVLIALAVIATIWSTLWIVASGQQTLDARVQRVASQLKCLICQGESVADSPSTLAQQMRSVIREKLQSGQSEQEVIQYFERSYGDKILWSPPWQGFSLLAWLVPIAFLLSGTGLLIHLLCEWRSTAMKTQTVGTGHFPVRVGGYIGSEQLPLDKDLELYRVQLEAELAEEDVLFRKEAK
jgi:cytochrome c-type biogenesis protein CcmH